MDFEGSMTKDNDINTIFSFLGWCLYIHFLPPVFVSSIKLLLKIEVLHETNRPKVRQHVELIPRKQLHQITDLLNICQVCHMVLS